jgi:hypothetical protein
MLSSVACFGLGWLGRQANLEVCCGDDEWLDKRVASGAPLLSLSHAEAPAVLSLVAKAVANMQLVPSALRRSACECDAGGCLQRIEMLRRGFPSDLPCVGD